MERGYVKWLPGGVLLSHSPSVRRKLYIGEVGVDLVSQFERTPYTRDALIAGILADYLDEKVEQSELRDEAIKFYRYCANSPLRNQGA